MYIARRKSRGGKRFGFVRMINLEEADRVTQRLNGATLYGSRLVVKIARDKQGRSWKRNPTGKSHSTEYKKTGIGMEDEAVVQKVRTRVSTEVDIGKENFKRIIGHVENEDLWNLKRCLVGVMDMWKKEEKSCEKSDELVEVLNVMCAEKDHIKCLNREKEICGDKIIEAELMGGVSKDEKLTAFHGNGDEELIKKASTLDLDEKVADGNYVGIQRVISVEKAGQVITKADGSDNGLIGVSSNRSGPESMIEVGFKDVAQEFKSSWANTKPLTLVRVLI
ncbi:hypothetical protein V6N13_121679 [Hibiscus sabdariffa]